MFDKKEYMKEYNRQYYTDHVEQIKKHVEQYDTNDKGRTNSRKKKHRDTLRQFIQNYKLQRGCALCGYNKCAGALEFHHEGDNKEFCISSAIRNARSKVNIRKEMKKCIILCANCHRELHEELNKDNNNEQNM